MINAIEPRSCNFAWKIDKTELNEKELYIFGLKIFIQIQHRSLRISRNENLEVLILLKQLKGSRDETRVFQVGSVVCQISNSLNDKMITLKLV